MATASSNVQVKFTLRGEDQASATINKVGRSMDQFGERGDQAADRAGKLSTALSSLGDFAGRSEGQFRRASEAAGAFDDVLTVMPGPIGIAVGAIAGLTTVLVLQAKKAREDAAALRQAFGPDLSDEIAKVAKTLDLNREAAIKFGKVMRVTGRSADDLKKEIEFVVKAAEEVGEDGSAAVVKFAEKLLNTTTAAVRLNAQLRQSVNIVATTAFGEKQAAGVEEEFEKRVNAAQDLIKQGRFRIRSLTKEEEAAGTGIVGAFFSSESANRKRRKAFKQQIAEARALVESGEAQLRKIASDRAEFAKRLREAEKRAIKQDWDDEIRTTKEKNEAIRKELNKTAKKRRKARTGMSEDERIENQLQDEALKEVEIEEAKAKKLAAIDNFLADNRINNIMKTYLARKKEEDDEEKKRKKKIDRQRQLAQTIIAGSSAVASALIKDEMALAPIKLAMTLGESALAFLRAKTPVEKAAAISAGALGVAQFASVMSSGFGGGSLPSPNAGGGDIGPGAVGAGPGGGGGRVVNVNFGNGVVLGNPHEVARTIKGALAVSAGTGF